MIFEKFVKNRLVSFLEKFKPSSKNQFRLGLSTENALYSATRSINSALNNKKTREIFLDLVKVHDTE